MYTVHHNMRVIIITDSSFTETSLSLHKFAILPNLNFYFFFFFGGGRERERERERENLMCHHQQWEESRRKKKKDWWAAGIPKGKEKEAERSELADNPTDQELINHTACDQIPCHPSIGSLLHGEWKPRKWRFEAPGFLNTLAREMRSISRRFFCFVWRGGRGGAEGVFNVLLWYTFCHQSNICLHPHPSPLHPHPSPHFWGEKKGPVTCAYKMSQSYIYTSSNRLSDCEHLCGSFLNFLSDNALHGQPSSHNLRVSLPCQAPVYMVRSFGLHVFVCFCVMALSIVRARGRGSHTSKWSSSTQQSIRRAVFSVLSCLVLFVIRRRN